MKFIKNNLRYTPHFETIFDLKTYFGEAKEKMDLIDKYEVFKYFNSYCNSYYNLSLNFNNFNKPSSQINIVLLITLIDEQASDKIVFMKMFYQSFFKNIVFCGKNIKNSVKNNKLHLKKFDSFTMIDFEEDFGFINHECMLKVIDMNYKKIDGILQISGDVLLKYWKLNSFISNRKELQFEINCLNNFGLNKNSSKTVFQFIDSFVNGSIKTDVKTKHVLKEFAELHKNNEKTILNFTNENCKYAHKIFYVPQNQIEKFKLISKIFTLNKIYSESALPLILSGLANRNSDDLLKIKQNQIFKFSITDRKNVCQYFIQEKFDKIL
jgi:hypothetical protein